MDDHGQQTETAESIASATDVDHDGFLSQDELSVLTVDKLKVLARAWSVSTSGLIKAEIIDALVRHQQTTLAAPADPEWDGDTATWGPSDGALGYEVKLSCDDDDVETTVKTTTDTTVDFSSAIGTRRGTFTFTVTAVGDGGKKLLDSAPAESDGNVKTVDLPVPTNLSWDEDAATAKWDAVDDPFLDGYAIQLYKDGSATGGLVTNTDNSYNFDSVITEDGTYQFAVAALTDDDYTEASDMSDMSPEYVRVTVADLPQLATPPAPTVNGYGIILFTQVPNATKYNVQLYKDDEPCGDPCVKSNSWPMNMSGSDFKSRFSGDGMYAYAYQAVGDNVTYRNSDMGAKCPAQRVAKLEAPQNVRFEDKVLRWDVVDGAYGYEARIRGVDDDGKVVLTATRSPLKSAECDLSSYITKAGHYTATVSAYSSAIAFGLGQIADTKSDSYDISVDGLTLDGDSAISNWSKPVTFDIDASEVSENG